MESKAVTLQAVITDVVEEGNSDDGYDYAQYVTYVYNGNQYKDRYDSLSNSKKAEAMLGKTVSITINPENPTEQLDEISARCDRDLMISVIFMMAGIFCADIRARKWRVEVQGWYPETVFRDARAKARRNASRWIGLLFAAGMWLTMYWRWPMLNRYLFILAGGAALVFGCVDLVRWIQVLRRVENQQYILGRDTLVHKSVDSDLDSTSYFLHYVNGKDEWKRCVSRKKYLAAQEGTAIETMRLQEKGRPYLCFSRSDQEGF